ncbi:hypothetical protein EDB81DRAFT_851494 [Dactylonectria macrodidyma]|uniref:Uncharacterized protein n=1 Tax=Dactylonectria macrodidyma TaxID=307937 RepID=A0A9P9FQ38_9HYPO|nr:hypothetical protein EDB81DRAFT_851494 [Dactylonectria macrodidyma]
MTASAASDGGETYEDGLVDRDHDRLLDWCERVARGTGEEESDEEVPTFDTSSSESDTDLEIQPKEGIANMSTQESVNPASNSEDASCNSGNQLPDQGATAIATNAATIAATVSKSLDVAVQNQSALENKINKNITRNSEVFKKIADKFKENEDHLEDELAKQAQTIGSQATTIQKMHTTIDKLRIRVLALEKSKKVGLTVDEVNDQIDKHLNARQLMAKQEKQKATAQKDEASTNTPDATPNPIAAQKKSGKRPPADSVEVPSAKKPKPSKQRAKQSSDDPSSRTSTLVQEIAETSENNDLAFF